MTPFARPLHRHSLPAFRICVLSTVVIAGLGGCSEYVVRKVGNDSKAKDVQGIQFVLTKPEFTMTQTAPKDGFKDATYTVSVDYVPDPKQTYTLQYDPGPFVDPTFGLTMGPGGTLAATNVAANDQIGPTIAALSTFTASLIGTAAKAAFDADSIRNPIVDTIDNAPSCSPTQRKQLRVRILDEFPDDQSFLTEFHYLDADEKKCLSSAFDILDKDSAETAALSKKAYDDAVKEYRTKQPSDTEWLSKARRAKEDNDSDALTKLGEADKSVPQNVQDARADLIVLAITAVTDGVKQDAGKKLRSIIDISAEAWRARHLLYLERKIRSVNQTMLSTPGDHTAEEQLIEKLKLERAMTLDTPAVSATKLYKRQLMLESFVSKIENRSYQGGGSGPAMDEYSKARIELDEVKKQLDDLKTAVLEAAKKAAPAAPPPPPARIVQLKSADFIDGKKRTPAENDPEYVIVLEEIASEEIQ
jgi:hypothetical protein